ncbi:MAG: hypothetical protein QOI12_4434 [Alphaproteobacteria bacterium]|jgi:hypothetical protein|nr:hypothetical protein [Alphaproteobacteria bacterium]
MAKTETNRITRKSIPTGETPAKPVSITKLYAEFEKTFATWRAFPDHQVSDKAAESAYGKLGDQTQALVDKITSARAATLEEMLLRFA